MALDIIHVDMDAFYAAVEQKDNPELQGKPVIIGGTGLGDRGVVSTASYAARQYGVHSAMPIKEARKLCPDAVFLPGRMERYQEISQCIFEIMSRFTPRIEKISIDEAFLDVKGCHRLFGPSRKIGKKIKTSIKQELDLVASIGLAPNKFLAKLASDLEKPDGFKVIREDEIAEILDPLPVDKIWGVGEKTEEILQNQGMQTIGDIKQFSEQELTSLLGQFGHQLYKLARGHDDRAVQVSEECKSISHETTFRRDLQDSEKIFSVLMALSDKVGRRLRKKSLCGKTVFIKIRYGDFTTLTRQTTSPQAFYDTKTIYEQGKKLIQNHGLLDKPVRLLGIGVSSLIARHHLQLSLFSDQDGAVAETVDKIKDQFGEKSIVRANQLIHKNSKQSEQKEDS